MEEPAPAKTKKGAGCLVALTWWLLLLVLYFNFGLPPPVTGTFTDQEARRFYIAVVDRSTGEPTYRRSTLLAYREGGSATASLDYRLPVSNVTISDGDIDRVTVLDEEDGSQRIEFVHNNSALIASIYRAGPAGIEPESVRVIANVGSGMVALVLIFPAYFLAWLTRLFVSRRSAPQADASE